MAIVAGRRNGGAYNTLTTADTTALSSLLPRDYETSTRNMVGFQATGWGIAGVFFPAFTFNLLGMAVTPVMSALMTGIGLTNIILGGKILGGSDDAAAANAITFNGARPPPPHAAHALARMHTHAPAHAPACARALTPARPPPQAAGPSSSPSAAPPASSRARTSRPSPCSTPPSPSGAPRSSCKKVR